MKARIPNNHNYSFLINEKSIEHSMQIMQSTWSELRTEIAQKKFKYNDTDSALKVTFLKQFNDWFQNIGKKEMSISFQNYFKNMFAGRGTIIKSSEPATKPLYDRFMPKSEFIKDDNRFSPSGVEWLYLAVGKSEDLIIKCAEKECRVKTGERFGFCNFKLNDTYNNLRIVDLTIADNMSYDDINNMLRTLYDKKYNKAAKAVSRYGYTLYGRYQCKQICGDEDTKEEFTKWLLYMYAKMMSENLFVPIETDDKKLEYAPFQTLATYFQKEGFDGIVYSSTVCPSAKNIVLFDKIYANPYGEVRDYIVSSSNE